ncbi:PfkB family carbohydrate kinase [Candidatus Pelagibacter sp. HIMB1593]|uniref:PfkB family carbohydrate kinase n=1 Tax=Candidatus Pelagibacter sp. HIMB1593 TaxID=3413355 RepID=UPI003F873413
MKRSNKAKNTKLNKSIGMVHGVFDVIHIGHIMYFKEAKSKVDKLIVSVTSDKYVNKGPGKPIFNTSTRIKLLSSIKYIDKVIESNHPTAIPNIKKIKPNFYIKGIDYKNLKDDLSKNIFAEKKEVEKYGGKLTFTDTPLYSSSSIINQNFDFLTTDAKKFFAKEKNYLLGPKFKEFIKKKINEKILIIGDPIIDVLRFVRPSGKSNKNNIIATRFLKQEENLGGVLLVLNFLSQFFKSIDYYFIGNKNDLNYIKRYLNENITIKIISSENNIIKKIRYVDDYSLNKFFQVNKNETNNLTSKVKEKFLSILNKNINKYKQIIIFDYGYNYNFKELNLLLQKYSNKLVVNCQSNSFNFGFNLANKYKKSLILSLDENEMRLMSQDMHSPLKNVIKKNTHIFKKTKLAIITQGRKGCFVLNNNKLHFIPTILKQNLDTTGCGDIFLSAFSALNFSQKFNLKEKIIVSHIAAGIHANELGNRFNVNLKHMSSVLSSVLK